MMWWILPLAAAAFVAAMTTHRLRRRRATAQPRYVAYRERLTALPEYQRALRRHRRWLAVAVVCSAVLLLAAAVAAARPMQRSLVQPEHRNRDIMLCLDVSGSMGSTDAALVGVFAKLAQEFDGERIGMVIFDSRAVQLFPLTDDYAYVTAQLQAARDAFDGKDGTAGFFDGTWNSQGSSLIGDGLATCVRSFPQADGRARSRSVILATDNFLSGTPIFTLEQAGDLARRSGVRVHALNPGDFDTEGGSAADGGTQQPDTGQPDTGQPGARLKAVAESTGGVYATPEGPDAVAGIVENVQATEAGDYDAAPVAVIRDDAGLPLTVGLIAGAGLLLAGWRLER